MDRHSGDIPLRGQDTKQISEAKTEKRIHRAQRLIFLGTGTSTGIPEVGCHCLHCKSKSTRDQRLRSSALIITSEGKRILIDVSPDFRQQAERIGLDRVDAILLTHEHYDHIGGIDDLRTITWRHEVPIYAQQRVLDSIQGRMPYIFSPNPYPGTPVLRLVPIEAGEHFEPVEGFCVQAFEVMHGRLPILGFRFRSLTYITDMKTIGDEGLRQIAASRLLVINGLRARREHPSHQSVADVISLLSDKISQRPELTLLTHLSHHAPCAQTLQTQLSALPIDMRPAYDMLAVDLPADELQALHLYRYEHEELRIEHRDCGRISYGEALELQKQLFEEMLQLKSQGRGAETMSHILYCEHNPVFTLGKHGHQSNILSSTKHLEDMGYEIWRIDRGGDVTYHGPGQITGYPILDLEYLSLGLREYIYLIEEAIIALLERYYSIKGARDPKATGVWLEVGTPRARKICAIGVRSSRFVTMHGFALNINTSLEAFRLINPCGFAGGQVTSLSAELGREIDFEAVKIQLSSILYDMLCERIPRPLDTLPSKGPHDHI